MTLYRKINTSAVWLKASIDIQFLHPIYDTTVTVIDRQFDLVLPRRARLSTFSES